MNTKIVSIFFIIATFIVLIKSQKQNETRKNDPEVYYKLLKAIYRLPDQFDELFVKGSVWITKPAKPTEWKNILETKESEAVGMLRNTKKLVQIRFVPANKIPSSFNYATNRITCNFKKEAINNVDSLPTEHKVMSVVNGDNSSFLQYYPDKSLQLPKNEKSPAVTVYVNDWHNSTGLSEWLRTRLSSATFEKSLRSVFVKIYKALEDLEKISFIYTDLSPSNILVDSSDYPYLVNLGNVIQEKKNKFICISNEKFHPPDLLSINKEPNVQMTWTDYLERLRTWSFCFNVYHAACQIDMNIKLFSDWQSEKRKDFLDYFGCKSKQMSKEFKSLIAGCLTKSMKTMPKFKELKNNKWLTNESSVSPKLKFGLFK